MRTVAPADRWGRLDLLGGAPRVDKYGDHDRNLPPVDQVVQHVLRADVAAVVHECLPVLEHHQRGGDGGVVLRRHVHPVPVLGAWEYLARESVRPAELALRHADLRQAVGPEAVLVIERGSSGQRRRQPAGSRVAAARRGLSGTVDAARDVRGDGIDYTWRHRPRKPR